VCSSKRGETCARHADQLAGATPLES
jgi:hypothetical protein